MIQKSISLQLRVALTNGWWRDDRGLIPKSTLETVRELESGLQIYLYSKDLVLQKGMVLSSREVQPSLGLAPINKVGLYRLTRDPHRTFGTILVRISIAILTTSNFPAHHHDQRQRCKMKYIHSEETLQVPEGGEYTQSQYLEGWRGKALDEIAN